MLWAVPGSGCPTSCQLVVAFRQGDPDKLAARRTTEQESAGEATALMLIDHLAELLRAEYFAGVQTPVDPHDCLAFFSERASLVIGQ